ncbi:response regulator transcription factor [Acidimicrobiia bacterium EGI L10123]|uniref:response regulator n=1 Tax=Salinilacustrithrix flava TaxID=2957203 RepID=UPI003D7C27E7|nr:response regulator transcription factor [Acidimicrobiia bacterium EGI L10123]
MDRTDDTREGRDVRVVIVDDNDLLVDTLVAALQGHPVLRVVATAGDGPGGLSAVVEHRPDVALVDLRLGGAWGLDLVPGMRAVDPPPAIVVFSAALDEATRRAVATGEVTSHVSKGAPLDELLGTLVAAADDVRSPRS